MANIDKQEIEDKKAAAKAKVNQWKRKQKPLVQMPELTGDAEVDSKADLDAVKKGFRDRLKAENKRKVDATDSEHWVCICFQTREQKTAFLNQSNMRQFGTKYLNGEKVAKMMGIELPDDEVPYVDEPKIDKVWASFVDDEE